MTEVEQIQTNGIDIADDDENNKSRPADIEAVCKTKYTLAGFTVILKFDFVVVRICVKWNDANVSKPLCNHVYFAKN